MSSLHSVLRCGLSFVFTDGHPVNRITRFFNDPSCLKENVDWQVMQSNIWYNTEHDPDRKRRRQAEFLVHGVLPWENIEEVAVYDVPMLDIIRVYIAQAKSCPAVRIRSRWYY